MFKNSKCLYRNFSLANILFKKKNNKLEKCDKHNI